MSAQPRFSVIVPVYNRPQEVDELLESLTRQSFKNFEVLLVEDGSQFTSQAVYEKYSDRLTIRYFSKPNSGPGPSRNYGFERASGAYFVVFDSDCVIPPHYFEAVQAQLAVENWDAWGGPDRGHANFTPLQQAMGFTMSSILTTGGIRGGKKRVGAFQPRSFNMGLSRHVFEKTGGFRFDRFAEDIELSIRMNDLGFKVGLIPEAYVFHKRRTSLAQFFRQVSNFGKGRILVGKSHPGAVKLAHWFPPLFLLGLLISVLVLPFVSSVRWIGLGAYAVYAILLALLCFFQTRSLQVAALSIPAAFVQMTGYGYGFLKEKLKTYINK